MIERYSRPEMKRIWTDENKLAKWLEVEIAVCESWAEKGVIPQEAIPKIKKASFNMERFHEVQKITHHDMTALLQAVSENMGEESRFIHLGLTTNDVWDTATSMQLVESTNVLERDIETLIGIVKEKAIQHKYTVMMGRTHGVHAEPITFGLKLAIWVEELKRNALRLSEAKSIISVGKLSGAVGTHATIPTDVEESACAKLGLSPAAVSNQVLQRDRHAQFVTTLAIIGSSLEKFATEVRGLQRTEVLEAEEPFEEGQTGSSAMPHKRNPELCERICGLARLVRGHALTSMENIALWHERDISHSSTERIILPDSCLALDYTLNLFIYIMKDLLVYPERMKQNLEVTQGLIFSQRIMLTLIEKGISRQEAYKLVQRNAMRVWREHIPFLELLKNDEEVSSRLSSAELEGLFDYNYYLSSIDDIFARLSW
ncbi:MAG: adenylosuccinate lyase [Chloroflexota bacterium]|nr:adenylosuccinate lyase [Chloroflexota bacterium]